MGISDLGGWLKDQLNGNNFAANPIFTPAPKPQRGPSIYDTINPKMPVPSFKSESNGGYSVQNLPAGTSTFAPWAPGFGVLQNPQREAPRFDPTGTFNDSNLPKNPNSFMLMPMAMPDFKPMPFIKPIGGF